MTPSKLSAPTLACFSGHGCATTEWNKGDLQVGPIHFFAPGKIGAGSYMAVWEVDLGSPR